MAKKNIVGRHKEVRLLDEIKNSKEAEFVAVYGRRRVGKTFLIREYFVNIGVYVEATGIKDAALSEQIAHFMTTLSRVFFDGVPLQIPKSWNDAFALFTEQLDKMAKNKKCILFLDELPWMASRKSKLLQALDFYWNRYWSSKKNVILIVCGSAASWMLSHLVNAKGGLHNRLTRRLHLRPFTLGETELFFKSRSVNLTRAAILDLYMVFGGVPFYLKEVKKGRSPTQIIDTVCFQRDGLLFSEFHNVFASLFDKAELNAAIVKKIAQNGNCLSRKQLLELLCMPSGGAINRRLEELEASHFIQSFVPYGKKSKDIFFRVVDEYTLFYLRWIAPMASSLHSIGSSYWQTMHKRGSVNAWAGLAFESVCLKHVDAIERALGLASTANIAGSWRYVPPKRSPERGAQIDLLFDREDEAITLCEIKYTSRRFVVDKAYAKELMRKIDVFAEHFPNTWYPTKKQLFLCMVTVHGVKKNMYEEELVHNQVTLNELFTS